MATVTATVEQNVLTQLKERFSEAIPEAKVERKGRISVVVNKDRALEVARFLSDGLGFDHAIAVAGVDYPTEKKIVVIYILSSYANEDLRHIALAMKIELDRDNPSMPSLASIWESANYHERETYEMFGVNFECHPNLKRLLLQDNWEGPPPMRKDIKFPEIA